GGVDRDVFFVFGGEHDGAGRKRLGESRLLVVVVVVLDNTVWHSLGDGVIVGSLFALGRCLLGWSLLGCGLLRGCGRFGLDRVSVGHVRRGLRSPGVLGRGRSHVSPFTGQHVGPGTFRTLV